MVLVRMARFRPHELEVRIDVEVTLRRAVTTSEKLVHVDPDAARAVSLLVRGERLRDRRAAAH
jgi:hypothetical protein